MNFVAQLPPDTTKAVERYLKPTGETVRDLSVVVRLSHLEPCGFQIGRFGGGDGEIRGLADKDFFLDIASGLDNFGTYLVQKIGFRKLRGVGGRKQNASALEQWQRVFDEATVVAICFEDVLLGLGECRRVQDNGFEAAALVVQSFEPFKDVSVDEVVLIGIEVVEVEVPATPVEVLAGQIKAGRLKFTFCRTDGECAGVGEGIQQSGRLVMPGR